jgi:hypothetical protein
MQANIYNAHKCNIQVYELAPPTCVLQSLIDPRLIDPLTMLFHLFAPPISYYLCEFSPSLSSMTTKGELKIKIGSGETMISEDHFPNLIQSRSLTKDI